MCGIIAVVSLNRSAAYVKQPEIVNGDHKHRLEDTIHESLSIVKHRGPDDEGQWISPDRKVALGHVRLSIVDLSPGGHQPFSDNENDVHAVVVGEFYGHEVIREQLRWEYSFRGQSDSEIAIALYNHYGISFLEHLRGEFALCLWDNKRKLFFAAADRYLIKPFYYTVVRGQLLVATEMKQFLAFGWKPEWDIQSLRDRSWFHNDKTFFRDVRKFSPGHYLISKNFESPQVQRYWDLEYPNKYAIETRTEREMIMAVREKLIESVRLRLRADVPVSVFLSGGLDSSSIAGVAAHLIKERGESLGNDNSGNASNMTCFTVAFNDDSDADESEIARRTAQWLGVNFERVIVNEEVIASRFEDAAWHSEMVVPDANGPGKLAIAEAAKKKGNKVVLTGEGSDEHFAGYTPYRADVLRERDHSWPPSHFPEPERRRATWAAEPTPFIFWASSVPKRPDSTSRMLNHTIMPRFLGAFSPLHFASWTDSVVFHDNQETTIAESFDGRVRKNMAHNWHPLHTSLYCWLKTGFANNVLRYEADNVDMAHHLESRTPFLDHHLTEYVNSVPPSLKMKYDPDTGEFIEKYILREAMRPFIPEEIYFRRKHMYLGPVKFAENGPLHELMRKLVTKKNVEELGWVDWEATKDVVEQGFIKRDPVAVKEAFTVAQFVVISQRFGVKRACLCNQS